MQEVRAVVTGTVQGVSYRDFVSAQARHYGVCGHVRNLPNGSVEVVAQGTEASLLELLAAMKTGPTRAHIERIETTNREPVEIFTSFEVVF